MRNLIHTAFIFLFITILTACSTTEIITDENFRPSDISADSIVAGIPDYSTTLLTVKGKGKAIVSEPENSQRATLYFSSNRKKSLITAKNSIGIEGGKLLTDGDSLLIYNKVDKYARKISVKNNDLERINNLASINLLEIFNIPVSKKQVKRILENEDSYLLKLQSGGEVFVNKNNNLIQQIDQPASSQLPYSRIIYDAYDTVEGLLLPRRITIFSRNKSAKIELLIQSLQVNPELGELKIDLPEDIKIYRQ
jgi:hypothetical protein